MLKNQQSGTKGRCQKSKIGKRGRAVIKSMIIRKLLILALAQAIIKARSGGFTNRSFKAIFSRYNYLKFITGNTQGIIQKRVWCLLFCLYFNAFSDFN